MATKTAMTEESISSTLVLLKMVLLTISGYLDPEVPLNEGVIKIPSFSKSSVTTGCYT